MALLKRKQLDFVEAGWVAVSGFTANGADDVVTTTVTTVAGSYGRGGSAIPVQPSVAEGEGLITSGHNRVEIFDTATKTKLTDNDGNEIYGRITEATGVYTLTYYVLDAGTETAVSFPVDTVVDFYFPYRFSADKRPVDNPISLALRTVYTDPSGGPGGGGSKKAYAVAVTALNTLAALPEIPIAGTAIELSVNGKLESDQEAAAPFTVAGTAVTWSAANAGYDLETTDVVTAFISHV